MTKSRKLIHKVGRMFHIDDDGAITDLTNVHACHINGPTDRF